MVTGGAGFIGSHLVDTLLNKGCRVICLDDFNPSYPLKFKKQNIKTAQKNNNYLLYRLDIRNISKLKTIFKKYSPIDSLIHLAARAGVRASIENPCLFQEVNIGGTYKLLSLCSVYSVKQFIFASSSSIYGNASLPFSENNKNTFPLSPYGATKLAGEQICYTFRRLYKIPTTILRFFSVYGPKGRPDMAPYIFTKAILENKPINQYGNGSSARDWTYVDDTIEGILQAIEKPFSYEIFNLGSNKAIKLSDLLHTIEILTGKKFNRNILSKRLEEPDITYANIDKAKKLLNWKPKTEFSKGMKIFIDWYRNNRL